MAKPSNRRKAWTHTTDRQLRGLAKQNTPTQVIGLKTGRTPGAVQKRASDMGLSLMPTNQTPYNRRKK